MAETPQKGLAVEVTKPGTTSSRAGAACVSRIPTRRLPQMRPGSHLSSPALYSPTKPLLPKGQLGCSEQRLHQPAAHSNINSPEHMSPAPSRSADQHSVMRLMNAAAPSPGGRSLREGQRLVKKRLREFCKKVLEGIETASTPPQSNSLPQGTSNAGAGNKENSVNAALHGSEPCELGAVDRPEPASGELAGSETPSTKAIGDTFKAPSPLASSQGGPQKTSTPVGREENSDADSSGLGNRRSRPAEGLPPLPTPDFAHFGRIWQAYWPSKHPFASRDSTSQESSLLGPSSTSSGIAVAVPLPDSPLHYTEARPSSNSPDFVKVPMVTRRRRPGVRPALATPPDNSLLNFREVLASSPAELLPKSDIRDEEEAGREDESEGFVGGSPEGSPASPWYLFPGSLPHSPSPSQSPLSAELPLSEPANAAKGPSSAMEEPFEWAIPVAPLPRASSTPMPPSSLHCQSPRHQVRGKRLSTVPELMETTGTTTNSKGGTSTALWPMLEGRSLLTDAQQPWLLDATFSSLPPGPQENQCEEKSWSSASTSGPSRSLLSFIEHEKFFEAEEAAEAAARAVAAVTVASTECDKGIAEAATKE